MAAPAQKDFVKRELLKCAQDPVYFLKTYGKIVHSTRGKIPFSTYKFQDECIEQFLAHRFNIILKSRQLGLSTVTAGYAAWFSLFNRDKTTLVIATKLAVAVNFIKKVKTIIDSLPPWFAVIAKITSETKQSITFANGSTVTAIPTSEDAGRSEALSLLIVDEAAVIEGFDEIWTSLSPTLSTGGRAILLSTPKGAAGQFYMLWQQAINKENDFNPITLPWTVHPEHDKEWFEKESKTFTERQKAQEFLCDFLASGETFLTPESISWISATRIPSIDRWGDDGSIWVWEKPIHGEKYIISADVSRGNAEDFSTFHVFKDSTNEQVAEYKGKIPPDELGILLESIGTRYNNALICPENNTYGYSTIRTLKSLKYKNIYYEGRPPGYVPQDEKEMAGFATMKNTRDKVLANLERAIRNKKIHLRSERTLLEMKTFVWIGQRARAQAGHHDDLIMSLAIAAWLLDPDVENTSSSDNAKYLIAAMSVEKRNSTDLVGFNSEVKPMVNPAIAMGLYTSRRDPSPIGEQIRRLNKIAPNHDPNDVRWVLG